MASAGSGLHVDHLPVVFGAANVKQGVRSMITKSARTIAAASNGNPVIAMLVVFLFYLATNGVFALVETLVWGYRFEHWGDVPTALAFMAYAGYVVWHCAVHQILKEEQK